ESITASTYEAGTPPLWAEAGLQTVAGKSVTVVEVSGSDLAQVIRMRANTTRGRDLKDWRTGFCEEAAGVLTERLTKPYQAAECIRVRSVSSRLHEASPELAPALFWSVGAGVKSAPGYYEISYFKFTDT